MSGIWSWSIDDQDRRLELTQKYQQVSGTLYGPEGAVELENIEVNGATLNFKANIREDDAYILITLKGESTDNLIKAAMTIGGKPHSFAAIRTP